MVCGLRVFSDDSHANFEHLLRLAQHSGGHHQSAWTLSAKGTHNRPLILIPHRYNHFLRWWFPSLLLVSFLSVFSLRSRSRLLRAVLGASEIRPTPRLCQSTRNRLVPVHGGVSTSRTSPARTSRNLGRERNGNDRCRRSPNRRFRTCQGSRAHLNTPHLVRSPPAPRVRGVGTGDLRRRPRQIYRQITICRFRLGGCWLFRVTTCCT